MRELRPGLWHWEAPHPDWQPSEPWDQNVASYAVDDGDRLLLFDPIAPPDELDGLAAERKTSVVLTSPWHERDTRSVVERLGTPVLAPPPQTEQAGGGSPDLAWLRAGEGEARFYSVDEGLPAGLQAYPGRDSNDLVLWIESHRAVIAGDTLVDFGEGLHIPLGWLPEGVTRDEVAEGLRPLLALPVEHVLATHGGPVDRTALERALA